LQHLLVPELAHLLTLDTQSQHRCTCAVERCSFASTSFDTPVNSVLLSLVMDQGLMPPSKVRPDRVTRNDCRTCVARRWNCDRAHPRCNNCETAGNVCPGYAMQLSWQPGFSLEKKPVKKTIRRRSRLRDYENSTGLRPLVFINANLVGSFQAQGTFPATSFQAAPQSVNHAVSRRSSKPTSALGDLYLTSIGLPDRASNLMKRQRDSRAGQAFIHAGDSRLTELSIVGSSHSEVSHGGPPECIDDNDSYNTICMPISLSQSIDTSETRVDACHLEDQTSVGTSPDVTVVHQTVHNGITDDYKANGTFSSPSSLYRPCAPFQRRRRAPSYHFAHTIPPRPLYTHQFEYLKPVFERCNVDHIPEPFARC
jgi:hypothetical protein